jgi:hypothetical protein
MPLDDDDPRRVTIPVLCVKCRLEGWFEVGIDTHVIEVSCKRCGSKTKVVRIVDVVKIVLKEKGKADGDRGAKRYP